MKRLKLKYDISGSNFAFDFNLRPYILDGAEYDVYVVAHDVADDVSGGVQDSLTGGRPLAANLQAVATRVRITVDVVGQLGELEESRGTEGAAKTFTATAQ